MSVYITYEIKMAESLITPQTLYEVSVFAIYSITKLSLVAHTENSKIFFWIALNDIMMNGLLL